MKWYGVGAGATNITWREEVVPIEGKNWFLESAYTKSFKQICPLEPESLTLKLYDTDVRDSIQRKGQKGIFGQMEFQLNIYCNFQMLTENILLIFYPDNVIHEGCTRITGLAHYNQEFYWIP